MREGGIVIASVRGVFFLLFFWACMSQMCMGVLPLKVHILFYFFACLPVGYCWQGQGFYSSLKLKP